MGGPASSTPTEIYMQAHERTPKSNTLPPPKVWGEIPYDAHSIWYCTSLESFFHHIKNLYQDVNLTLKEDSNGELVFLDTLLTQTNE